MPRHCWRCPSPAYLPRANRGSASFFEASVVRSGPPGIYAEPGASGDGWQTSNGERSDDVVVEASDPRASGLLTATSNYTDIEVPDGAVSIVREAYHLVNDEGSWRGGGSNTLYLAGGPPSHVAARYTLVGEGTYEGLTLELHGEPPTENMEIPWWGVIYPTEATPAMPDASTTD